MKHIITVAVPATTREVVNKTTCDLCGIEIKNTLWDVADAVISYRTGYSYPDGGSGEEFSVDMCGPCFSTRLVPWLKEQGAAVSVKDWTH